MLLKSLGGSMGSYSGIQCHVKALYYIIQVFRVLFLGI